MVAFEFWRRLVGSLVLRPKGIWLALFGVGDHGGCQAGGNDRTGNLSMGEGESGICGFAIWGDGDDTDSGSTGRGKKPVPRIKIGP